MACGNSKHLCYAYETAQWHKVFHHVLITDVLRLRSSALMIYIYIYTLHAGIFTSDGQVYLALAEWYVSRKIFAPRTPRHYVTVASSQFQTLNFPGFLKNLYTYLSI